MAILVTVTSAFALKAHKRATGNLFTAAGTRVACNTVNQGLGSCPITTIPLYTKATAPHTIYTAAKFATQTSGI
jgi:hypothetical protein